MFFSSRRSINNSKRLCANRFRPALETLEDRALPSFLTPVSDLGGSTAAAVGDFNGDGRPDIVSIEVGDMGATVMAISLNDGN